VAPPVVASYRPQYRPRPFVPREQQPTQQTIQVFDSANEPNPPARLAAWKAAQEERQRQWQQQREAARGPRPTNTNGYASVPVFTSDQAPPPTRGAAAAAAAYVPPGAYGPPMDTWADPNFMTMGPMAMGGVPPVFDPAMMNPMAAMMMTPMAAMAGMGGPMSMMPPVGMDPSMMMGLDFGMPYPPAQADTDRGSKVHNIYVRCKLQRVAMYRVSNGYAKCPAPVVPPGAGRPFKGSQSRPSPGPLA